MNLIKSLQWRYATKAMNGKKITTDKLHKILEAARLAPTSSGLQPFQIVVIKNRDLLNKIRPIANNQLQIASCSHLLIFAVWNTYTEERINKAFDRVNEVRGIKNEGWEEYRKKLLNHYPKKTTEENFAHATRQAYIALGFAVVAAAQEMVDSTPMEGFKPDELDKLLGLETLELKSSILLPLGYRDEENDWLVNLPKVRTEMTDFIIEMS